MVYLWRFKRFPESGTSPEYVRILLYLKNNGPATSRELVEVFKFKPGMVRRALQHLRRIGAVEVLWIPKETLEDYDESSKTET